MITGATGFVGGAVAASVASAEDRRVALIRARTQADAYGRLWRSLSRFIPAEVARRAAAETTIFLGDLTVEGVLDHPALDGVTHVVHAAACTSFASTRQVWRSNLDATVRLLERIRRAPRLTRFLHVSTAYCCGDRPARIVYEDDSPSPGHSYVNEYTRSKAEAERVVLAAAGGLPILVARPSVVVGHTRLGVAPSASLFWYYRALAALAAGPFNVDTHRDIVPVDYVAEAILFLLRLEHPGFVRYHISAGARCRSPWRDILSGFHGGAGWRTVTPSDLGNMYDEIRLLVQSDHEANLLARGLRACAEFGSLGVDHFDNQRLIGEGFGHPPHFTDYLPRCIESSGTASIFAQMVDES